MAAGDEGGAAAKPGIPLWIILAGGAGLALFLIMRSRRQNTLTDSPLVPAVVTDPNTGLPVNPLTGLPYQGSTQAPESLGDWVTKAQNWMIHNGIAPSLAASAVYNYVNGLQLTEAQQSALSKAVMAVGFAPGDQYGNTLPWKGPSTPNPTSPKGPYFQANLWKWFGLQKGETYSGLEKIIQPGGAAFDVLGNIGALIRQPGRNAPIYALVHHNWTPANRVTTGAYEWRRIDSAVAFGALPRGTRVATMAGWPA